MTIRPSKKLKLFFSVFTLLLTLFFFHNQTTAQYATGGSGLYRNNVYWLSWGSNGTNITSGTSRNFTVTSGSSTLQVTCRVNSYGSGTVITSYRPGNWTGDGLDDLYNIGGTGSSNTLVVGLNGRDGGGSGNIDSFRFNCSATVNGSAYTLPGIVVADSEQSVNNGTVTEYVQGTPTSAGTWRIIDRFRTSGCTSTITGLLTGSTLRMSGPSSVCSSGPMTVSFLDGGSEADVVILSGGTSAVALGVVLNTDYGDAPSSYGSAIHVVTPTWSGGTLTASTNTSISNTTFTLATPAQPTLRLGTTVDYETATQSNSTATGDDSTTAPGTDDENGVTVPSSISQGQTLSIPVVVNGSGRLNAWFDWNRDGDFADSGEQIASDESVSTGTTNLSVNVPANASAGTSYARFRLCTNTNECNVPANVVATGEVEDYSFTIATAASYTITKSSNGPWTIGQSGAQYTLNVTNIGGASSSGTITVLDTLPTGITANWTGTRTVANFSCTFSGQNVTCTRTTALTSGGTATITLPVNVTSTTAVGTNSITNYASIGGGGDPFGSALTPGTSCTNTAHCTSNQTTVTAPDLTISKTDSGSSFTIGSLGNYALTVSNSGTAISSGTITVSDTLPAGLIVNGGTANTVTLYGTDAANWSCNSNSSTPQTVTCTSSTAISASGSSTFNFDVYVGSSTSIGTITNTASVSGGGEVNTTNNSGSDSTTVLAETIAPAPGTACSAGTAVNLLSTVPFSTFQDANVTSGISSTIPLIANASNYRLGTGASNRIIVDLSWGWNNGGPENVSTQATYTLTINGTDYARITTERNPIGIVATVVGLNGASVSDSTIVVGSYPPSNYQQSYVTLPASVTQITSGLVTFDAPGAAPGDDIGVRISTIYACSPAVSVTKTSNGPWTIGQSSAEYTLTATNSGSATTFGTTTIRDVLPTGITANWTGTRSVVSNGLTWACTFSGQDVTCTTSNGLSNVSGSNTSQITLPVNVTSATAVGTNSITNYASIGGGGDPTNSGSAPTPSSSCSPGRLCTSHQTTVNSPDLTIAKSHTPTSFVRGSTGTYNLTVNNTGTASTSGAITVVDTLPTGLTVANGALTLSGTNAANWTCNAASNVITCSSSTAIAISGSSVFSFNVNVAANVAATVTNNVTVAGGGEPTVNNGNNSATDPTATVLPPSFGCTDKGYAIKNAGTIAEFWEIDIATGASTQLINPIIPASLGSQGANSIGYNPLDGLIYGKRIGTSEIIRIASDLSVQIIPITGLPTANLFAADVSANGIYYLTRTGYTTIERVDVNPSSPTYMTRLTPINVPAVNYSDIAINPNDGYAYAITDGAAPHSLLRIDLTTGSVTTIGTVTGGGSEAGTNFGSSWMDSNGNLFFNQGANGNTYKIASTQTLTTGAVTSTFVSTTTTGINDGAKCNTSAVVLGPNVSLAKSHTGNFTVGSSGTYSFTVSNTGETATSGTITVTDTLPIGLTVNGGGVGAITEGGTNAANWTCNSAALAGSPAQQTITCTSTTAIATSGTSVFSFNVNVGVETAVGTNSITNTATVAGGGEIDTTNNSTSDPTTVLSPDLTIVKSHSSDFTRGSTGVYNITVGNSGTVATSGTITVSDTLPAGLNIADGAMTLGGANSANWACNAVSNVITCTSSTVIAISGSSVFSFTVNVASNAAATVNNTATVSGGNEATANNSNNSSIDPTNIISSPPNVVLNKSCPSPADCTTAPQLPGTDVTYRIAFTNSGGQGASNMMIVDGVPANTDFKLGSVTTSLGTTGLTIAIEYSNDFNIASPSSATWTYTPVSSGGGASAGYDRNVKAVRWRVTSGTLSNVSPNNNGYVEFAVKIR